MQNPRKHNNCNGIITDNIMIVIAVVSGAEEYSDRYIGVYEGQSDILRCLF